jgi:hypothetical protein
VLVAAALGAGTAAGVSACGEDRGSLTIEGQGGEGTGTSPTSTSPTETAPTETTPTTETQEK